MQMLQQRLEMVKTYSTTISLLHAHTEPSNYLGLNIPPTFSWAPYLDGVLKEARRKGGRLLMSLVSIQQKAQALDTGIGSCMA